MPLAESSQSCVHIRWMIRRDMPSVLAIEEASFEFPWSEEDFIRCLRQRNCIGMVAERDDQVVGFMIYELHKNRLHLLNFCVDPAGRRSSVGRSMADKLSSKLSHDRRNGRSAPAYRPVGGIRAAPACVAPIPTRRTTCVQADGLRWPTRLRQRSQ